MLCSEWALVKYDFPTAIIIPLRCKCWHCDECRPMRQARLIKEAQSGKPNLFVTLTSRRRPESSPDAAARALVRAWRTVRAEYTAKHGKGTLPFLAVFEATKKGWPHLHIVARAKWLDQKWLSRRMGQLIGSPVVDVRRIRDPKKISNYVAKYIGKNPEPFKGVKRYWRSLNFFFPTVETELKDEGYQWPWVIVKDHWQTVRSPLVEPVCV